MDKAIALLYSLIRQHLEYCVRLWPSQFEMDRDTVKCAKEVEHDGEGTVQESSDNILREKKDLRRNRESAFKYWEDCHKEEADFVL